MGGARLIGGGFLVVICGCCGWWCGSLWWLFWLLVVVLVYGYGFYVLRLILSGLVNWVCLDLEKNMKNEVCGGIFCFKETHVYS